MVEKKRLIEIPPDLMPKAKDLPGDLRAVADVVGVAATIKLAQSFRGTSVYFRNVDNILRKKRNAEIRGAYNSGTRIKDIARTHHLSARSIAIILSGVDDKR